MHTYWRLGPAEELASSIRSPAQAIRGERAVRLEDALRAGKILSLGGEKVNAVKRGSHPPPTHRRLPFLASEVYRRINKPRACMLPLSLLRTAAGHPMVRGRPPPSFLTLAIGPRSRAPAHELRAAVGGAEERRDLQWAPGQLRQLDEHQVSAGSSSSWPVIRRRVRLP